MSGGAAMTAAAQAEGRAFVNPPSVPLALGGVDLVITPLRVGEVAAFAGAVAPIVEWIPRLVSDDVAPAVVLELLSLHSEAALSAVAIAARQPKSWVAELMLDELAELATVCLEVNADFFRRALPALERSGARIQATFSAGSKPSSC